MPARTFAFKVLSLLVIFVFLFSNTAVALAQQPVPATATPAAPAQPATPAAAAQTLAAPTDAPAAAPAPTETQALSVFSISGKVTGKDGQPLAGVSLADDHGNTTTTGADGAYTLPGLQPGTYLVAPKLEGQIFLPYYRVVRLAGKDASGIDFYVPKTDPDAGKIQTNQPAGAPVYNPHQPGGQAAQPPASGGDLSSQAVYAPGAPGLSYRYNGQTGVTGRPYAVQADDAITYLNGPVGVALDHDNNLLVAEEYGSRIVRFSAGGASNLSIGTAGIRYIDNHTFSSLLGAAEQPVTHTIWAADSSRLAEYDSSGTFMQNFPSDDPWNNGTDNTHFNGTHGIAFNDDGSQMYVSDTYNNRVQVYAVANDGSDAAPSYIRTIDGTEAGGGGTSFNNTWHLTYYDGSIYVADLWNNRIQKCSPADGGCTTFNLSGAVIDDRALDLPTSIAFGMVSSTPYAFITDGYNQRVLRCDADGTNCVNFAGTAGELGSDASHFFWPEDISVGIDGMVYVADRFNHIVQVFDATSPSFTRLADRGTTLQPYPSDSSHLNTPYGMAVVSGSGSTSGLYVSEKQGQTLVKYDNSGTFQWRVGKPGSPGMGSFIWWSGEPNYNSGDVDHFSTVGLDGTLGVDSHGRIYVPDYADYRIVIYLPDGTVFGTLGDSYGTDNYHFNVPTSVAINPANDDIYVADSGNSRVQVYDSQHQYKGTIGVTGVQGNDSQHFSWPTGLAVDASGHVYVADQPNMRVQKCTLSGSGFTCVPFAGVTGASGPDFRFTTGPVDVAVGPDGLVYVVEEWQARVNVFDPSGAYRTTLGGNSSGFGTGNLSAPAGVAVDSSNNVYVADSSDERVIKYGRGIPAVSGPPALPGWTQLNVNGWGEQTNDRSTPIRKVTINSQDYLYAGTENSSGQPISPSVWRMDPAGKWQAVSAPGFGDLNNSSIVDMIVYGTAPNEYLYANTFNWNGAQIWRCPLSSGCDQNSDWQQTAVSGQDAHTTIFTPFQTFGTDLYVSSASYYQDGGDFKTDGAKVWKLTGNTWAYAGLTLDTSQAGADLASIQSLAEFNGYLLAGSSDWVNNNPGQLWRYDGTTWDHLTLDGFGDADNNSIPAMVVFKNNLYVGTGNNVSGAKLYSYDTSFSLTPIISDGFGDTNNISIQNLAADANYIYAVTHNSVTGLQIWRSSDGSSWDKFLSSDGFGSNLNAGSDLSSSLLLANDRVYLGTWNATNGGGLWASDPSTPYSISGIISPVSPATLPDNIIVTLQPGNVTTRPAGSPPASNPSAQVTSGFFSFTNLGSGSYTVTAARAGCAFTPSFTNPIVITSSNITTANFNVTCTTPTLLSPADGTQLNTLSPTLNWSPIDGATSATKYTLAITTGLTCATAFKTVTQAVTSYALSGLANGVTYCWHVKEAAPIVGPWSVTWKFTSPTPPAAPALLNPINSSTLLVGNLRPVFTWKAVAVPTGGKPVQHYHLQISQTNTFDSLDLDEYTKDASLTYTTPFDLNLNRVYYWRMRAFNTLGGYSNWSSVYSFKVLPGAVGLDDIDYGSILLQPSFTWHDDWNTGKYTIQICKVSGSKCTLFKSATVTTLSYSLTSSLLPHTVYNWRVQAVGTATGAGPWTDYMSWTTPAPPPAPTLTWPAANAILPDATHSDYMPTLDWSDIPGVGYYQLQVSTDAGFSDGSTSDYGMTVSFQTVNELDRNQVYWWHVRACNSNDECSVWTTARKLTTKPGVPASDVVAPVDNTDLYSFSWTDGAYPNPANKYNIQICNTATCSSIFKSDTVTNSREYQLLLPSNTTMYWRVQGAGIATGDWMDPPEPVHTITTPVVPVLVSPLANEVVGLTIPFPIDIPKVQFSWNTVTGADEYQFLITYPASFDGMDSFEQIVSTNSIKAIAFGTDSWSVRAGKNDGSGHEDWGLWSAPRKVLIKPVVGGQVQSWLANGTAVSLPSAAVTMTGNISSFHYTYDGEDLYYFPPNLPIGAKTVTASMAGYLTATRNLTLANGGDYLPTGFWLAPVNNSAGDYRIVLSWDSPLGDRDLDLHAWLPPVAPGHIYWGNEGNFAASPFVWLSMHDKSPTVEIMDMKMAQLPNGKTVIGVNQYSPGSGSWSGTNVKVEVFQGTDLQKSCMSANGTGLWWYAMDITVTSGVPVFTCKTIVKATSPAPYADQSITGTIKQSNGHPVRNVAIDYGGASPTNVDSPFTLTGLDQGPYTLTPSKTSDTLDWTFSPPSISGVMPGADVQFQANPPASIMVGGPAAAVASQGDYLYVGGGGKLYIVNIKDKSSPTVVNGVNGSWIGEDSILNIAVQGNHAYLAEGTGLDILDISDPANPTIVGSYVGMVNTVTVADYYAYLASGTDFIILDVHDPAKPKVVIDYSWDTPAADHVLVQGNDAYVGGTDGLWVFDVSDPSKATYLSHWGSDSGNPIVGLAWNNGHLIVTDIRALYDLNVDNPAYVIQDDYTDLPAGDEANQSAAVGNTLYVAFGSEGLLVYDIGNPWDSMPQLGTLPPTHTDSGLAAQDIYVYMIDGGMVQFVDASRPTSPIPAGGYTPTP